MIDEILATGRIYPPIRAYSGDQVVWEGVMHEHREPEAAVPYPMVLMQPQWRIEQIMRERLAGLGHYVELGTEAITFEQDEDGVTVTLKRAAPERLLDTYEEERLPVAADVLGISTRLYARARRNEQDAHVRDEETQQLLLGYRDGSLAAGERGGERAPDATLEGGRLFDALRGPHFTLLALGTAHAALVKEINATYGAAVHAHTVVQRGEAGDLIDVDGQVHDHYGQGLVLIRPDGYVGYHGDESGLGAYLFEVTVTGA